MPKALIIDEGRIRQILINLIGNAIKFTDKGYIKVIVTKKANKEADSTSSILEIKLKIVELV